MPAHKDLALVLGASAIPATLREFRLLQGEKFDAAGFAALQMSFSEASHPLCFVPNLFGDARERRGKISLSLTGAISISRGVLRNWLNKNHGRALPLRLACFEACKDL